jgi:RNA-directed DNA polymerase
MQLDQVLGLAARAVERSVKSLAGLSAMFAPILKGWQQYYGRFHGSALKPVWQNMNLFLTRWLMRKYKG